MATQEVNPDLDLGEEKPSNKKLIIIIAIVAVLLLGGGIAAYFLLFTDDSTSAESDASASVQQETDTPEVEQGSPQYYDLDPELIITLPGRPSLLQVGVNVRIYSDEMVEFLKHNDPMIRHHLLNLLQSKDAKSLDERGEKEALQQELLVELNRIVKELSGPGQVDALFFTSFVMQ